MISVSNYMFRVTVKVLKGLNSHDFTDRLCWDGLTFDQVARWKWYFDYRAALLKVKNPKQKVETVVFKYEPESRSEIQLQSIRVRNRMIAKKRKITELNFKVQKARNEWAEIFPINDHPSWPKVIEKVERLKNELSELEELYSQLQNDIKKNNR